MAQTAPMPTIGETRLATQTTTNKLYSPLVGQRDIRLLEVLPGDDPSVVATTLVTVSLDSNPTYAALSYAWGDATQRSIIECNGRSISITMSLAEALKAFRSFSAGPDAPLEKCRKIWADQLCINQRDVLERNHQVGFMGSIYSSSTCAFIWLGPRDEGSDRAISFIDFLHHMCLKYVYPDSSRRWNDDGMDLLENAVLRSDNQAWAELKALMERPWFSRCWTLQEPILAPHRVFACGSKIRDWNTCIRAALTSQELTHMNMASVSILPVLVIHHFMIRKPGDLSLSDLISTNWARKASDPRDKVYALYGLLQDYQNVHLEINYATSVGDVYKSAVRFSIENEGKLSILGQVSQFRNHPDQPSWVPDWREKSPSGCSPVMRFGASSATRSLVVPSSSDNKLILKGFTLSTVERTIETAALGLNLGDDCQDSWRRNAAAAGVPVRFLQGKRFQTTYDLITMREEPRMDDGVTQATARTFMPSITRWIAAGRPDPIPLPVLTEYKRQFESTIRGTCMFVTKDSLGLAPAPTQVGDRVCILLGGDAPFILRPRQNTARTTRCKEANPKRQSTPKITPQGITKSRYGPRKSARVAKQAVEATEWTLIGDCHLYGYMRGEAMETVTEADYMNFTLV